MALLFCPGTILVFFKAGPFAWNGLLTFWVPFATFFAWIIVLTRLLLKATDKPDEPAADNRPDIHAEVARLSNKLVEVSAEVVRLRDSVRSGPEQ